MGEGVVLSIPGAKLNGLVDGVQQVFLLQRARMYIYIYIYIYCEAARGPDRMIDLLEKGFRSCHRRIGCL